MEDVVHPPANTVPNRVIKEGQTQEEKERDRRRGLQRGGSPEVGSRITRIGGKENVGKIKVLRDWKGDENCYQK